FGGVQRRKRLDDFRRQLRGFGDFFDARLTTQFLLEAFTLTENTREVAGAVQGNAHGTTLVRERGQNRLANPPHSVRDELHTLLRIELPRSRDQSNVAFLNQVRQRNAAVLILLGYADHETQVRTNQ